MAGQWNQMRAYSQTVSVSEKHFAFSCRSAADPSAVDDRAAYRCRSHDHSPRDRSYDHRSGHGTARDDSSIGSGASCSHDTTSTNDGIRIHRDGDQCQAEHARSQDQSSHDASPVADGRSVDPGPAATQPSPGRWLSKVLHLHLGDLALEESKGVEIGHHTVRNDGPIDLERHVQGACQLSSDIPQVACRLTSRSPDFARWASVFRPERCLSSRKRPKSGGSSLEPAAFWPGRAAFPRGRRTCPAAFVQLGHGSWSCA